MNTKEFEEIKSEDLYEVTGGANKDTTGFMETIDKIYSKIKEFFTS